MTFGRSLHAKGNINVVSMAFEVGMIVLKTSKETLLLLSISHCI